MKFFSVLTCSLMLTTLSAVAQDGPGNSLYRKYFAIKFSAKLYYKSAAGDIMKMGSTSGKLSAIGRNEVKLVVGGETLPVLSGNVWSDNSSCSDKRPEKSPNAEMSIPSETMKRIMLKANPSIFKLKGTEDKVAKVIRDLVQSDERGYFIGGSYCTHSFLADEDNLAHTTYLNNPTTHEGIKLVVEFSKTLSTNKVKLNPATVIHW